MQTRRITITDPVGLHARPAAQFVQEAQKHPCRVILMAGDRSADAKSILQVLSLGIRCGQEVVLVAEGPGEEAAIERLSALLGGEGGSPSHDAAACG
ncbi:MAG: HPr family phosphocarrier protein [Bacillota bacterium]|nr:HPr family phosphocarrier protein [Bacillota bacterium]PZN38227.1 MAG: HPr family phosphocarrier protein [Bacillota bacterium]